MDKDRGVRVAPGGELQHEHARQGGRAVPQPAGAGGSRHSAAARARTRGASVIVAARGRISRTRLPVSRSVTWSGRPVLAQSGTPDGVAAAAGRVPPASAAGWPAPPATALPHPASTTMVPAAARTGRAGLRSHLGLIVARIPGLRSLSGVSAYAPGLGRAAACNRFPPARSCRGSRPAGSAEISRDRRGSGGSSAGTSAAQTAACPWACPGRTVPRAGSTRPYRAQLIGLTTRVFTGWLDAGDAEAVYAPHTYKGFVAPPRKKLLLVSNGLIAKFGSWQARRQGRAGQLEELARRRARPGEG